MSMQHDVLSVLTDGPLDLDAVVERTGGEGMRPDVAAALAALRADGLVEALHLQTLPPRTIYRRRPTTHD